MVQFPESVVCGGVGLVSFSMINSLPSSDGYMVEWEWRKCVIGKPMCVTLNMKCCIIPREIKVARTF